MPIDTAGLQSWISKIERAQAALKPEAADALEEIGEKFLDMVCDEIMAANNVDTRLLLSSFHRGSANNIWQMNSGALTLTVGSALDYAKYVNDGHRQQPGRFVPGVWSGSRFTYIPGAKSGMVLKASFVAGSHFFDNAETRIQRTMDKEIQEFFDKFWQKYFG